MGTRPSRSKATPPWVPPRKSPQRLFSGFIFLGLGIFCFLPGIAGQELPPTANPEHYTTKRTWIPAEPLAINDEGVVIGKDFVIYKDHSVQLLGPIGRGVNSVLVSVNNKGQVLVAQAYNGPFYFVYDPVRNQMTPVGLNARVQEGATVRNVRLGYITRLDDDGKVYGVYGSGHGPCGVVGTPSYGKPGELKPPAEPATFTVLGCPGGGDLHIRAINSKGQMTGGVNRKGFLWSDGKLSIFQFPGSLNTEGVAINEAGLIAGVFWVGNPISETGEVAGKFVPGLPPPQKGFTYDGTQFRLLFMQRGTPIYVTGINNRGQITGHYDAGREDNKGFVIDSATLPVAHMEEGKQSAAGAQKTGTVSTQQSASKEGSPPAANSSAGAAANPKEAPAAPHEVANAFASPAGVIFSGSNAVMKDGSVTFTLKAPTDKRNGQTLVFKGLIPVAGQEGKAWITEDQDGYVVFSMLVPGVVTGQVLPKAAGGALYEKAVSAQNKDQ